MFRSTMCLSIKASHHNFNKSYTCSFTKSRCRNDFATAYPNKDLVTEYYGQGNFCFFRARLSNTAFNRVTLLSITSIHNLRWNHFLDIFINTLFTYLITIISSIILTQTRLKEVCEWRFARIAWVDLAHMSLSMKSEWHMSSHFAYFGAWLNSISLLRKSE
jgi:hypothetical protein